MGGRSYPALDSTGCFWHLLRRMYARYVTNPKIIFVHVLNGSGGQNIVTTLCIHACELPRPQPWLEHNVQARRVKVFRTAQCCS